MPKLKTHKGAKSRFHITGSGKVMRMKGGSSHFRIRKTKRVKRLYDSKLVVHKVDKTRIKRLIP
ncbi:50S ribosomal protein L35, partial [Chloroflexota bacterium]